MPVAGIHRAGSTDHGGATRYLPGSFVQANRHKDAKEILWAGMCASSVSGDQAVLTSGEKLAPFGMGWEQPHRGGRGELCRLALTMPALEQ